MIQSLASHLIGWLPVILITVLVSIFLWRRLWRDFPFFFLYLSSVLIVGIVRYISYRFQDHNHYFYVYWISDMFASVVSFLPMYEVFFGRMFVNFYKTAFYRFIFPLFALIVLILTVLTALEVKDQRAAFHMAARAFDFMRTTVLIFFIGIVLFMGRSWKRQDLGITLGFAIQASVALANAAVKARIHYQPSPLETLEAVAYNISCLIWLFAFFEPDNSTANTKITPSQVDKSVLQEARIWETMLKTWLTPGKPKR